MISVFRHFPLHDLVSTSSLLLSAKSQPSGCCRGSESCMFHQTATDQTMVTRNTDQICKKIGQAAIKYTSSMPNSTSAEVVTARRFFLPVPMNSGNNYCCFCSYKSCFNHWSFVLAVNSEPPLMVWLLGVRTGRGWSKGTSLFYRLISPLWK